ncbi:MAG TPA: NAD(P)-dependent alcohol dehydrogenase [Chlamydiales bacterium]|jgi:uncharacterized zinc-type alcohol dehydrogenase-like protein
MNIHAQAALAPSSQLFPFAYAEPSLGPFDVLIEITHCGLCHSDIHLIDDAWKRSIYPLVPGHEVVGNVIKRGASVSLPIGARVGASWLYSACLECSTCLSGENQLCPSKKTMCIGHHGGFSDKMTADSRFVFLIPQKLPSELAAPLLCAGATVYAPLKRWNVQAGKSLAVIGIGGLGHVALQFGKALGCDVTAISSSPEKQKDALRFGANHFFTFEQMKEHRMKYDFILSTVHHDLDWNSILSSLKPSGTLCFLGRPPQPISLDVSLILSSQRTLTGSSTANRPLMNEMLAFAAQHKIAPQIELMKMSQINEAIQKVRANEARYRIVLIP